MPRFLPKPELLGSGRRPARGQDVGADGAGTAPDPVDGAADAPATGQMTRLPAPPSVPPVARRAAPATAVVPGDEPDQPDDAGSERDDTARWTPGDGEGAQPPVPPVAGNGGAPAKGPGRAGRDLGSAIGVGVGLGAVILAALLIWRPAFLVVITAAVLISIWELTGALAKGGHRPPRVPLLVGAVAIAALAWTRGGSGLVVGFLLTVFAVLLWRLGDGPAEYLDDAATAVFVAFYIPLLAGFAVLLLVPDDGVARVLTFIAAVVCSDVGGYAAGVLFGKHPMAPTVSPKKSWEGLAGSILTCVLLGVLLFTLTFHGSWWGGAVYGVAIALTATIGDLGESLIKRDLGIKDMGTLLPGHGGLMDRMDSLLPSAAIAYLLLSAFVPS